MKERKETETMVRVVTVCVVGMGSLMVGAMIAALESRCPVAGVTVRYVVTGVLAGVAAWAVWTAGRVWERGEGSSKVRECESSKVGEVGRGPEGDGTRNAQVRMGGTGPGEKRLGLGLRVRGREYGNGE